MTPALQRRRPDGKTEPFKRPFFSTLSEFLSADVCLPASAHFRGSPTSEPYSAMAAEGRQLLQCICVSDNRTHLTAPNPQGMIMLG